MCGGYGAGGEFLGSRSGEQDAEGGEGLLEVCGGGWDGGCGGGCAGVVFEGVVVVVVGS